MLLVLDNCEHLVEACAALVDALLRSNAGLGILATRREPPRITGESAWTVPSLFPPDPQRRLPAGEPGRNTGYAADEDVVHVGAGVDSHMDVHDGDGEGSIDCGDATGTTVRADPGGTLRGC